ncbi:hypothetical protein HDU76_006667 [Blyttiomyces sp. JEL0837]|nr:hypothetical protein HDU76_006667 [Blyttiomyces sp. JEL0837]
MSSSPSGSPPHLTTSRSNSSGSSVSSQSSSRSSTSEPLPLNERRDVAKPGIGLDSTIKEETANDNADHRDDRTAMILDQPDFQDSVQSVNPRMNEYEQKARGVLEEMLAIGGFIPERLSWPEKHLPFFVMLGESAFSSIYKAVIQLFENKPSPLLPFTEAFLHYITQIGTYDQIYVASLAVEHLPINQDLANDLALLLEISHEDLDITLASIAAKRVQKVKLARMLALRPLHGEYLESFQQEPLEPTRIEALPNLTRLFPIIKQENKEIVEATDMSQVMEILATITGNLQYHGTSRMSWSCLSEGIDLEDGREQTDLSLSSSFYTTTSLLFAIRTAYQKLCQNEDGKAWLMIFKLEEPDFDVKMEPPSKKLRGFVLNNYKGLSNYDERFAELSSADAIQAFSHLVERTDQIKFANNLSQTAWRTPRAARFLSRCFFPVGGMDLNRSLCAVVTSAVKIDVKNRPLKATRSMSSQYFIEINTTVSCKPQEVAHSRAVYRTMKYWPQVYLEGPLTQNRLAKSLSVSKVVGTVTCIVRPSTNSETITDIGFTVAGSKYTNNSSQHIRNSKLAFPSGREIIITADAIDAPICRSTDIGTLNEALLANGSSQIAWRTQRAAAFMRSCLHPITIALNFDIPEALGNWQWANWI